MPTAELPRDHLTDYERAICYFTLPNVVYPINSGIIVAYAVCVFEAAGALVIGLVLQNPAWMLAGAAALWGIVLFGLVVFTGRALLSELRRQRALAQAHGVPNAHDDADDLPDPFAGHILLRHPAATRGKLYSCTAPGDTIQYFVDSAPGGRWWKIRSPHDIDVCEVRASHPWWRWATGLSTPRQLSVRCGDLEVAAVLPILSLSGPAVSVRCYLPEPREYQIRQFGIFHQDRLVGRIYWLRQSCYLDLEENHLHPGILAYYVTLT
jgi:hypothetical protein